ncbi:sortase-dependent protein, partial [Actinacidiphila alni]
MRRTVLSAVALACTAVLAGSVPAFADGASPTPSPTVSQTASTAPSKAPGAAPTAVPSDAPGTAAPAESTAPGQVAAVPQGAP